MIIYKTTNLINGKIYVGKDVANNPKYFGSGIILERSIKKHGPNSFKKETLEECHSLEELNQREVFWIKQLNSTDKKIGYNIALGGDGGDTFSGHSDEIKEKLRGRYSEAQKKKWENDEYRKRHKESIIKMWQNPSHKKLISKLLTGREIKWKNKIGEANKKLWQLHGDVRSEETKKRVAEINRQKMMGKELKPLSDATKQKIIKLYKTIGPKLIEKHLGISIYLIIRFLKKEGIYQKWQKGIGDKAKKQCSISRRGAGNPMWKGEA